MRLNNSKKELARIISENGGWRDGEFAVQNGEHGRISFSTNKPVRHGQKSWMAKGGFKFKIEVCKPLPSWHQIILSRVEYFHLYPAPDADGWIEHDGKHEPAVATSGLTLWCRWSDGLEQSHEANMVDWVDDSDVRIIAYRLHKPDAVKPTDFGAIGDDETNLAVKDGLESMEYRPTIEQLAAGYRNAKDYAERKQQEADTAKADADAKLKVLELAGEDIGLLLSPITAKQEPEPVAVKFTGKFHSAKHGDRPSDLDMICDGCGKRFGHHVGFDCRP